MYKKVTIAQFKIPSLYQVCRTADNHKKPQLGYPAPWLKILKVDIPTAVLTTHNHHTH